MQLLDPEALVTAVAPLSWTHEGTELVKLVKRRDFADALRYVNNVAAVAEEVGHHPDIDIRWDTVTLRLSTHSLGGITDADIALATRLDALS